MLRKIGKWFASRVAAVGIGIAIGAAGLAGAGGIAFMPSTAPFNEPSQEVATFNAFINYLNGNPGPMTNGVTPGIISLGSYGTISGGTPQTLNLDRGLVTFTGVTVAAVSTGAVVINNSQITAANVCRAWLASDNSAAGSFPYVRSVITGAGTITVNISNAAAATSTGSSSFGVGFDCVN